MNAESMGERERTDDSLAFASISTDDFKFDGERATQVLCRALDKFFSKVSSDTSTRLVLVDPFMQLKHELLPKRLNVITTSILSAGCAVVAIGCNKLFKAGGDRINNQVHKAFGASDEFTKLIRERYPNEVPHVGKAYPVRIPSDHVLSRENGVKYVINVLGPNMNPNRLDCLDGNYSKAEALLENAYSSMFECFLQVLEFPVVAEQQENKMEEETEQVMERSRQEIERGRDSLPPFNPPHTRPPPIPGLSLRPYMTPSATSVYREFIWFTKGDCVVIHDGYPKATFHALVLHRKSMLNGISEAKQSDLPTLREMHQIGRQICSEVFKVNCRMGYHALPSLTPLHLHVISQDLSSPRINSAKHWNSFQHPDLFIPASKVESELHQFGQVMLKDRYALHQLESESLKCHVCGLHPRDTLKNSLEALKRHKCVRLEESLL